MRGASTSRAVRALRWYGRRLLHRLAYRRAQQHRLPSLLNEYCTPLVTGTNKGGNVIHYGHAYRPVGGVPSVAAIT